MNTSIFVTAVKWIWNHKPDVAIVGMMIYGSIALTSFVNGFHNRLGRVEETQERIREEIQRNKEETNERFDAVNKDFEAVNKDLKEIKLDVFEIKLFMQKIDTYLTTTQKDYKGGE